MTVAYDKYYQTEHLFGEPYPELIRFFSNYPSRGNLLDLGCGQGRDAIPLARLGYKVTGVDQSAVGIRQMERIGKAERLNVCGIVGDIYLFPDFENFEFILLDSLFHFRKTELKQESGLIERLIKASKKGTLIVFCIQDSGHKIDIFNKTMSHLDFDKQITEADFSYTFEDKASGHSSTTNYKMIVVRK